MRTVSQLAELAGVTVRTLHHYDQIGLLTPSARSAAGYRLYDHDDLLRLQQILSWRELGVGLSEIAVLLDDPGYDQVATLRDHRVRLAAEADRLELMLKAIDAAIEELDGGRPAEEETMFEGFDGSEHAEEARERWGDTEAWAQSQRRAATWTDADRARIQQQGVDHAKRMARAFTRGVPAESVQAMDLAEEARLQIDQEHYACSKEMHVHLGEMYVADARFTQYYDQHAPGLAAWFRDAILANADR